MITKEIERLTAEINASIASGNYSSYYDHLFQRGSLFLELGQFEKALTDFDEILKETKKPSDISCQALWKKAYACFKLKQYDEVIKACEILNGIFSVPASASSSVDNIKNTIKIANMLGVAKQARGDLKEAETSFKEAIASIQKLSQTQKQEYNDIFYNYGYTMLQLGALDVKTLDISALDTAERLYAQAKDYGFPKIDKLENARGYIHYLQDRLPQAQLCFLNAYQYNKSNVEVLNNLGAVCLALNNPQEAAQYLKEAVRLNGRNYDLYQHLALSEAQLGHDQAALEALDKSIEETTNNQKLASAYLKRAKVKSNLKQNKEAEQDLENAMTAMPEDALILSDAAFIYLDLHQYEKAIDAFKRSLTKDLSAIAKEYLINIYNAQGSAYLRLQKYSDAQASFDQSIDLAQHYGDKNLQSTSYGWRAEARIFLGVYDKAVADYKEAIEKGKMQDKIFLSTMWSNLGSVFRLQKKNTDALEAFEQAKKFNRRNISALQQRAQVKEALHQYEEKIMEDITEIATQFTLNELQKAQEEVVAKIEACNQALNMKCCAESELREQIAYFTKQQEFFCNIIYIKNTSDTAEERFKDVPNLLAFYNTYVKRLEEFFIALKAIASEYVDNSHKGKLGRGAQVANFLSTFAALLPMFGSTIGAILDGLAQGLSALDNKLQTKIICDISHKWSYAELMENTQTAANQLTNSYEQALLRLSPAKKDSTHSPAERLAAFGVLQIIEAFMSKAIDVTSAEVLSTQFIKVVTNPKQSSLIVTVFSGWAENEVEMADDSGTVTKFSFDKFYQKNASDMRASLLSPRHNLFTLSHVQAMQAASMQAMQQEFVKLQAKVEYLEGQLRQQQVALPPLPVAANPAVGVGAGDSAIFHPVPS